MYKIGNVISLVGLAASLVVSACSTAGTGIQFVNRIKAIKQ